MARPLRIEYPGAVYHVTARGNARQEIFRSAGDREALLAGLLEAVRRYHWCCHAYCLMDNHYHLLVQTVEPTLSRGMRHVNGVYTQRFNGKHKRVGHVFQGRFKAILVEKERHLLELCRYVVLNPVRAGIVPHPREWIWSSYRSTCGEAEKGEFLEVDWILGNFGTYRKPAQRKYRDFVEAGMKESGPSPWNDLRGQIALGGGEFVRRVLSLVRSAEDIQEVPRIQKYASRPSLSKIFEKPISSGRNAGAENIKEAYGRYGYRLKEIGEFLGVHYSTVSRRLKDAESKEKKKR